MKKLTILVDLDDTLTVLCKEWVNFLNELHNTSVTTEDIVGWDICKAFPELSEHEVFEPLFKEELWERVKPADGAVENVKKLIDDGHRVLVVTATHYGTLKVKLRNTLFKYFPYFSYKDVVSIHEKQLLKGDILIDDAPHNLQNGSYMKILYPAPHNRFFNAEANGMIRVNNWDDIYKLVSDIAERGDNNT